MNPGSVGRPAPLVRMIVATIIITSVAVLISANAHLVYVAFSSQPDCVTHSKTAGEAEGGFRAAKSSC